MTAVALLLLTLPSRCGAVSFHAPTTTEEKAKLAEVEDDLAKIAKNNTQIGSLNDDLNKAKMSQDSEKEQRRINGEIDAKRQQATILYNEAIHAAISAYGIAPDRKVANLVMGGEFKGRKATWMPVFGEVKSRWLQDYKGHSMEIKPPVGGADALTWPTGQIEIGENVFTSPAFLAAIIAHETIHFEQRTTHGRGDRPGMTFRAMELEAYNDILSPQRAAALGLQSWETAIIDSRKTKALNTPEDAYVSPFAGLDASGPDAPSAGIPGLESIETGGDSSFGDWLKEAGSVGQEVAQRNAAQREADARALREKEEKDAAEQARLAAEAERQRLQALQETQDRQREEARRQEAEPQRQVAQTPPPGKPQAQDRDADKASLIGYYQRLANITYSLCDNPEAAAYHSGPNYDFCYYGAKAREIAQKYEQSNLSLPADYDADTENSDCGRELLDQILAAKPDMGCNNYAGTDGRDYDGEWIRNRARTLHQKYYPATPQPGPRPKSNPAPRDPNWRCPPGCTCVSGSQAACPPSP